VKAAIASLLALALLALPVLPSGAASNPCGTKPAGCCANCASCCAAANPVQSEVPAPPPAPSLTQQQVQWLVSAVVTLVMPPASDTAVPESPLSVFPQACAVPLFSRDCAWLV
jgi:hypothetical protein